MQWVLHTMQFFLSPLQLLMANKQGTGLAAEFFLVSVELVLCHKCCCFSCPAPFLILPLTVGGFVGMHMGAQVWFPLH